MSSTRASGSQGPLLTTLGRAGARHRGSRYLRLTGRGHPAETGMPTHISRRRRGRNQILGNRYPIPIQSRGRVPRRTLGRCHPQRGRSGRHSGLGCSTTRRTGRRVRPKQKWMATRYKVGITTRVGGLEYRPCKATHTKAHPLHGEIPRYTHTGTGCQP